MSVNGLFSGIYRNNNTNSLYQTTYSLITQSTSMESQVYSYLQQMDSDKSSSETVSSAYTDIDTFLKTYQSELNTLKEKVSNIQMANSQSVFRDYEKGTADLDDVVAAVGEFVDSYNEVTKFLESNAGRGAGTASHLSSFQRGLASGQALESIGISYDKNGKLVLDEKKLKENLEKDYGTTTKLIGGQYGLADRANLKAEQALEDSVQRIVSNDLSRLVSDTQNFDSISYTYNFSRSGAYNLTNMYMVGLFVNTMA